MKNRGQLQLEATICIALLFAITAAALSTVAEIKTQHLESNELLFAKAGAHKCSLIAGTIFGNGSGKVETMENCFAAGEHKVVYKFNDKEKSSYSLSRISSTQTGSRTILEAEVNAHYQ